MHTVIADITHQQRADAMEKENIQMREQIASMLSSKVNKTPRRKQMPGNDYALLSEDAQLSKTNQMLQLSDKIENEEYATENEQLRVRTFSATYYKV